MPAAVRREQARRGHSVSFAGTIEIVSMLVVAQEYRVDLSDLICRPRRPGQLFQRENAAACIHLEHQMSDQCASGSRSLR